MEHETHAGHSSPGESSSSSSAASYNINFQVAGPLTENSELELSFVVTEQKVGEPIESFDLLHDRLMHLIIVDETLSYFGHVHPTLRDGTFRIAHVFPAGGRYKLWAETKPHGSESVLTAFRLDVGSDGGRRDGLRPSEPDAGYRVTLTPSGSAPIHQAVALSFEIADPEGNPVTDLEPLMAAGGHCVIISSDLRDFLHVHPTQDVDREWRGGPRVEFVTSFHRPGSYRVWGQFQHRGSVITAGFALDAHDIHQH